MNRILVLVVSLVVVCLAAPAALAKGASEASISGPGIGTLRLPGEGQEGGEQLEQIAGEGGFFPAVFATTPDPMLQDMPEGTLGPKYTIEYTMPGPNNELDVLVQDVYPYASPSPVTYTEPDQPFWTTERTVGGWFVAGTSYKELLVAAGLPASPPTTEAAPSDSPWTVLGPVLVVALLAAVVVGLAVVVNRRRPQPA